MIEDVEEGVLRTRLAGKLLYIVDYQHVYHLIEVYEIGYLAVFVCRLELCLKLVHRYVEHLQLGVALSDLVAYGLHDMGLAQSRISIYIKRVESVAARRDGHGHAGRACQTVAFALDMVIEGVVGIELRVDENLAQARYYERIFYICRVGLRIEARYGRSVGIDLYRAALGARYRIVQSGLSSV